MSNITKIFTAEGFQNITNTFQKVHKRFPLTLLASLAGTVLFILFIENERDFKIGKLLLTIALAVPLMFSVEIFNERKHINKYIAILVGLGLLMLFYVFFQMENEFKEGRKSAIIFAILAASAHLLVSVSPYLDRRVLKNETETSINQFWQYNKILFLNILNAFLYSFTLAGGLCLALLAIDKLFEVKINDEWYRNIFIFINGYCNTIFFLSKLPSLDVIDSKTADCPIGLKYFTQYVLLPLVVIYVLILLAYEFKIIIQWSLPKGWVSVLVMASAIFGILAFLLLYPLRNANKWVAQFTKLYYWILIPLICLMMVAIYVRIKAYGITEPRYFIALISVWLLGISIYFGFSKIDNIKIIPISLIVIGLLAIFGPLNAFYSSRNSQLNRLEKVLVKNNLMNNGLISIPKNIKLDEKDKRYLSSSIDYLSENNLASMQKYFSIAAFDSLKNTDLYAREEKFYALTGLKIPKQDQFENRSVQRVMGEVEKLYASDYATYIDNYRNVSFDLEGSKIVIAQNNFEEDGIYSFQIDGEKINFNFDFLKQMIGQSVDEQQLTVISEVKNWSCRIVIDRISFNENNEVQDFSGKLYLTKK